MKVELKKEELKKEEPKVEFVPVKLEDIATASHPSVVICDASAKHS